MKSNWLLILFGVMLLAMIADTINIRENSMPIRTNTPPADCWTGAGPYQIPVDSLSS